MWFLSVSSDLRVCSNMGELVIFILLICSIHANKAFESMLNDRLSQYHLTKVVEHWSDEEASFKELSSISFNLHGTEISIPVTRIRGSFHNNYRSTFVSLNGSEETGGVHSLEMYSGSGDVWAHLSRISPGLFIGIFSLNDKIYQMDPSILFDPSLDHLTIIYSIDSVIHSTNPSNDTYAPVDEEVPSSISNLLRLSRRRKRRSISSPHSRCSIEVVADHFFFNIVSHGSRAITTRYIASLIERVNIILIGTDWGEDNDGIPLTHMGLAIKRIYVHVNPTKEANHYNSDSPHFFQYNREIPWDVSNLLYSFTRHKSTESMYCLRLLLTARPMDTPVRGMAYLANLSKTGGICANIQSSDLQYNTLIVNVYDGTSKRLLVTREVDLIITHEMGHAWGANHDGDSNREECSPSYRDGGLFIMHEHTLTGYDENNSKFSNCSKASIREILSERRESCFEADSISACGNGVVEGDEDCDEGGYFHDGSIQCCTHECTFIPKAKCSPLNDPCCSPTCSFRSEGYECLQASLAHCSRASKCTGKDAKCPSPIAVEDGMTCVEGGKCSNGTCLAYCEILGMKSCICEEASISCHRCCSSKEGECLPVDNESILPDGSKCIHGRCMNSTCMVEHDDLVSQFFGQLSDRSSLKAFFSSNLVGIFIFLSLIIYIPIAYCITRRDNSESSISPPVLRAVQKVYTPLPTSHNILS